MPTTPNLVNNFIGGLKTEFTALNFPPNTTPDSQNVVYDLVGDASRRLGIDAELNSTVNVIGSPGASSEYVWTNVGGDGQTQILVQQAGNQIFFYLSSNATVTHPLSTTLLPTIIDMTQFQAAGNVNVVADTECQFTDGNGFLFITHKDCEPIFCSFNGSNNVITPSAISIQIRDFVGIPEPGVADNFRPSTLSQEHLYNLVNQGWTQGSNYTANCNPNAGGTGPGGAGAVSAGGSTAGYPLLYNAPIVGASWYMPIITESSPSILTVGAIVNISFSIAVSGNTNQTAQVTGVVTSYTAGTDIIINVLSASYYANGGYNNGFAFFGFWSGGNIVSDPFDQFGVSLNVSIFNKGFIGTWNTDLLNFPSNSDVWWLYKDDTGVFNPTTTFVNVQQNVTAAAKGSQVLNPWNQDRSSVSGVSGLTSITTTARPSVCSWFQGRVFYSGVNASQQPTGDEPYTTWTENIYFSQIVQTTSDFGKCLQTNDPTSQDFFSILASDGGVITIQGSGAIFKIFPIENGLVVFAANGIWFITGSQGIGFSASDYTIRKISNIQSIGYSSYINVNGYPMFWNEEGIYYVTPSQQGVGMGGNSASLQVTNMTLGTILSFYQPLPKISKQFARGDYDRLNYLVQWCFRSTVETGVLDRYQFDRILVFNTVNKAFYYYTLPTAPLSDGTQIWIRDVKYIQNPGGTDAPDPILKYLAVADTGPFVVSFFEENNENYVDYQGVDGVGANFVSYFVTAFTLPGHGVVKSMPLYVNLYLRNEVNNSYKIQYIWDFAANRNSNRFSTIMAVNDNTSTTNFGYIRRRHKIRGHGYACQMKITSIDGKAFDVIGWALVDITNSGM